MKIKKCLFIILLFIILLTITACKNENQTENVENNTQIMEEVETEEKAYTWIIEPKIIADDIIDLEEREEVSLIKKGINYNFINNDQGKELLREDFFGYSVLSTGEIDIWQEGGKTYKVNEDYSLEEIVSGGDYSPNIVYYNLQTNELFTQQYSYMLVNNEDEQILKEHKNMHDTNLEVFVEVKQAEIFEDEFDKYAEFSEEDLGKYGYYNKETLEIEIPAIYDKALNFYEGYSAVKKDGKAGYINQDGKEIFPFEFEETRSLDKGRAWVKIDGKWGVIELIE